MPQDPGIISQRKCSDTQDDENAGPYAFLLTPGSWLLSMRFAFGKLSISR